MCPPKCPRVDMRNILLYIIYKFKRVGKIR